VQPYAIVAAVLVLVCYLGEDVDVQRPVPPQPVRVDAVEKIMAAKAETDNIRRSQEIRDG
jgi:hypothetical protein